MRLTLLQSTLHWENPEANRAMFAEKLVGLRGKTDLVVLPEMFTTGFSMNAAPLAEPMDGPTMGWLRKTSEELGAAVTGSFICADGGQFFNRLVFMRPNGQYEQYDKKHLFSLGGENEHYIPGKKRLIVEWQGWRVCPLICYDLRFPVWSRNRPSSERSQDGEGRYDLLIYVANWPSRRGHHWRSLLIARAIENQAYVVGSNIVGADGDGLKISGDSAIVDFSGQTLSQIPGGEEGMVTLELSFENLQDYRQQLPFLKDGDEFEFRDVFARFSRSASC